MIDSLLWARCRAGSEHSNAIRPCGVYSLVSSQKYCTTSLDGFAYYIVRKVPTVLVFTQIFRAKKKRGEGAQVKIPALSLSRCIALNNPVTPLGLFSHVGPARACIEGGDAEDKGHEASSTVPQDLKVRPLSHPLHSISCQPSEQRAPSWGLPGGLLTAPPRRTPANRGPPST